MHNTTIKNYSQGYSLIELVITVGLISILAVSISAIVLTTIVNSTRIKNQIRLRQSGDYAIGQIQTLIRNSRSILSCDPLLDRLMIENQDGNTTTISLSDSKIASNSAVFLTPVDVTVSAFTIDCLPSGSTDPKLVNLSFSLDKSTATTGKAIENPTQKFNTSIEVRN